MLEPSHIVVKPSNSLKTLKVTCLTILNNTECPRKNCAVGVLETE